MFGISGEHLLVLGIILLIFGPRRLPELGNTLGKAIRNFKDSLGRVEEPPFRNLGTTPETTTAAADQNPKQQESPALIKPPTDIHTKPIQESTQESHSNPISS